MVPKSVNPVGSERIHTFYEMQCIKLKKDPGSGELIGELCSLIELDGYDQTKSQAGVPVSGYIHDALAELTKYLGEKNIVHTDAMGPWQTQRKMDTQKPDEEVFKKALVKFYTDCKKMKGTACDKKFNHLSTMHGLGVDAKYDALMNAGARDSMKSAISGAPAQEEPAQEEPTQETME